MQKSRVWMFFVALAGLCWGVYVPLVAEGGKELNFNGYAAFLCVGAAYFLIAVLLPLAVLWARGKGPGWNAAGVTFSTLAGVAGAVGALCVILAVGEYHGPKIYVAPVIFALAPVINTLVSLFWHPDEGAFTFGLPRERPHWSLYLGILLAAAGAGLVLAAKELSEPPPKAPAAQVKPADDATPTPAGEAPAPAKPSPPKPPTNPLYLVFVLLAGLSWGVYVPLIAQGGKALKSSYASFLCVGAAYFLIAVLFPLGVFGARGFPAFNVPGTTLATLAGVAGAVGALCVIFATFEFKGPRIYVAPVIFALAPVINTLVSLFWHPTADAPTTFGPPPELPHWLLYVGIVAAGLGAGMVLFAKELGEAQHAAHARATGTHVPPGPAVASEALKP